MRLFLVDLNSDCRGTTMSVGQRERSTALARTPLSCGALLRWLSAPPFWLSASALENHFTLHSEFPVDLGSYPLL